MGIDPFVHTIDAAEKLRKQLKAKGKVMVPLPTNPVDAAWGETRPGMPQVGEGSCSASGAPPAAGEPGAAG